LAAALVFTLQVDIDLQSRGDDFCKSNAQLHSFNLKVKIRTGSRAAWQRGHYRSGCASAR
jgi:hypothetical protein